MSSIKLFESKKIRSDWSVSEQKWYFAIIDVIEVLTESNNPRRYWSDLKRKLNTEGFSQLYEIIVQLKIISSDEKRYGAGLLILFFGSKLILLPFYSVCIYVTEFSNHRIRKAKYRRKVNGPNQRTEKC